MYRPTRQVFEGPQNGCTRLSQQSEAYCLAFYYVIHYPWLVATTANSGIFLEFYAVLSGFLESERLRAESQGESIVLGETHPFAPAELAPLRRPTMRLERLTYSVEDASRLLGISRSHAYLLTETGELPCIRLGMCKRIAGAVIEAIVSGKTFRVELNYCNDNINEI